MINKNNSNGGMFWVSIAFLCAIAIPSLGAGYYFAIFLPSQALQQQAIETQVQKEKEVQAANDARVEQEKQKKEATDAQLEKDRLSQMAAEEARRSQEQAKKNFVTNTIQCKQFGATTNDYKTQQEPPDSFGLKGTYANQEFAYNAQLNSCLAYYSYDDNFQNPPHPPIEVIFDLLHKKILYRTFYFAGDCRSKNDKCVSIDQFQKIRKELFTQ